MGSNYEHLWYRERSLKIALGSELIGTALLAFTVATLMVLCPMDTLVPIGIGGVLLALCNICGDLSGAHFNPSITVAVFAVERRFTLRRCIVYVLAQLVGATAGFNLASWFSAYMKNPYSLSAHDELYNVAQILVCEAIFTYIMTITCLRCAIVTQCPSDMTPLWIAGSVVAAAYAGGPISGACMNPALAVGFNTRAGNWIDLVIYSVGPLSGAFFAALSCIAIEPDLWLERIGLHRNNDDLECGDHPVSKPSGVTAMSNF